MNYKIENNKYCPCKISIFAINGIQACKDDFGYTTIEQDGYYGCHHNFFTPSKTAFKETLEKYRITEKEFFEIGSVLEKRLKLSDCICTSILQKQK